MKFDSIYHEYVNMVYNVCLHYVQHTEDAQEITQDVFLKVHDSLPSFKATSSLSTWIYRIAINTSLDFIKAKKTKKRFAFITSLFYESNEVQHEVPHFEHPGVMLEQKEQIEKVFEEINKLKSNQKTAIILSKIEHKSHQEIADIMQLSVKAVESLVQRAKVNLLKKINQNEGTNL